MGVIRVSVGMRRAQILAKKVSARAFTEVPGKKGDKEGEVGIEGTTIQSADSVRCVSSSGAPTTLGASVTDNLLPSHCHSVRVYLKWHQTCLPVMLAPCRHSPVGCQSGVFPQGLLAPLCSWATILCILPGLQSSAVQSQLVPYSDWWLLHLRPSAGLSNV